MKGAVADAADALYGAPLDAFVAERKRLADELKAAGDKAAAAEVAKLRKPSVSAWVVNQLYRSARGDIDALLAAAEKLRAGKMAAQKDLRAALAGLRARAEEVLRDGGHKASESTLQRVQMTLQAISAAGGLSADEEGRLVEDRDPPGFEALGGWAGIEVERDDEAAPAPKETRDRDRERERRDRQAEVHRLEKAVERAQRTLEARTGELESLRFQLRAAESAVKDARAAVADAEEALEKARRALRHS